jgi:phage-related protein
MTMSGGVPDEMKPIVWLGASKRDLMNFPSPVRHNIGFALMVAQFGGKHRDAKPLKGFGGGSILEVIESFGLSTYRAVYTVRYKEAVYVLHAFQKKSRRGIATPQREIHLVRERLKRAEELHRQRIVG